MRKITAALRNWPGAGGMDLEGGCCDMASKPGGAFEMRSARGGVWGWNDPRHANRSPSRANRRSLAQVLLTAAAEFAVRDVSRFALVGQGFRLTIKRIP